jgi:Cu(I)/Ag(I) efflux system membrane protein CusA/SilA
MPIKGRIDMLATGIRTPVGVKVIGKDLAVIETLAREIEVAIKTVQGTSSAFAERIIGGYYLEIEPDRTQLARYGLTVGEVQQLIASAIGAETITTTVEGRERYNVSLRYPRDVRSDPDAISREVLVSLANGASVPLGQVAKIKLVQGPASIRTKTHSSPPTSSSTRAIAISAATLPTPSGRWRRRSSFRKGTTRSGAASSNTTNVPGSG